jgi:hypothetical protein
MPEGNANIEIAQHLREHSGHGDVVGPSRRHIEMIEILEAIFLGIVAMVTALSGYQAAKWDGASAKAYATSSRLRIESNETRLTSNELLVFNSGTFTAWLQAYAAGDSKLKNILSERFTQEYKVAFNAWLKLDPLNTPAGVPPGPHFMPEYKDPLAKQAKELSEKATTAFEEGVHYRSVGEDYVRVTVILAAVLFLLAIGQRFRIRGVRLTVTGVAGAFLIYCVVLIAIYPHA